MAVVNGWQPLTERVTVATRAQKKLFHMVVILKLLVIS